MKLVSTSPLLISIVVGGFDLLNWWKSNTKEFSILSQIAKDIFAIPTSTVASESAFSLKRRVVDPFRAPLTPKMVEALVCTSDWLRADEVNFYKKPMEDMLQFYKEMEEVETSKTCFKLFSKFVIKYSTLILILNLINIYIYIYMYFVM